MKIIFLDIDGVLNSISWVKKIGADFDDPIHQMDPDAVARLNTITDTTGACIVVSSTWRLAFKHYPDKLMDCMASYGITGKVIGMTPELYDQTRSDEIHSWLNDNFHLGIDSFTILDDDTLKGDLDSKVIKTSVRDGLLDLHVKKAIKILGVKS